MKQHKSYSVKSKPITFTILFSINCIKLHQSSNSLQLMSYNIQYATQRLQCLTQGWWRSRKSPNGNYKNSNTPPVPPNRNWKLKFLSPFQSPINFRIEGSLQLIGVVVFQALDDDSPQRGFKVKISTWSGEYSVGTNASRSAFTASNSFQSYHLFVTKQGHSTVFIIWKPLCIR